MQIIVDIVDNNFQFDTFVTCLRQDANLEKKVTLFPFMDTNCFGIDT